jgi:hypothetical protein
MKTSSQPTDIRNFYTTARGTRHIETEDNTTTYGFKDVSFWIPSLQQWVAVKDADKFLVIAEDFEEAKSTFWVKWQIYINKRFPSLKFVKIEAI